MVNRRFPPFPSLGKVRLCAGVLMISKRPFLLVPQKNFFRTRSFEKFLEELCCPFFETDPQEA
jgi:hypothetical protein